jgi:glycine cleavage system H protein
MMAYKYDSNARYAKSHEWARLDGKLAVIGISDYAQHTLSDIVYVELPDVGDTLSQGESFGSVESVKAAEEILAPISGEVVEVNTDLEAKPEWLNEDPFGKAWLVKVAPTDQDELGSLMDAQTYAAFVTEQEEKGAH